MGYSFAADLIVILHFGFILFVLMGAFLVLKWPRVLYLHIPALTWGALIEFMGWGCPLTPFEKSLRVAAGEKGYAGGFVENYLIPLIYPGELTREFQIWAGFLVIFINVTIYGWIKLKQGGIRK